MKRTHIPAALALAVAASLLATTAASAEVADPTYFGPYAAADGSKVYFAGYKNGAGVELFSSDGTPQGTTLVKDIVPGKNPSMFGYAQPRNAPEFTNIGDKTFFFAADKAGAQLWVTDGTGAGTVKLTTGTAGQFSGAQSVVYNGQLYFSATSRANGREVWKSDGTKAGTVLAIDVQGGTGHSFPGGFTVIGDSLYFFATEQTPTGQKSGLYRSNDGATAVKLAPISYDGQRGLTDQDFAVIDGLFYYVINNILYVSDGTSAGSHKVETLSKLVYGSGLSVVGDDLYFRGLGPAGPNLQRLEGDTSVVVSSLNVQAQSAVGDSLYFVSVTTVPQGQVWRIPSTDAEPVPIIEVPTVTDLSRWAPVAFDGGVYFWSKSTLYRTDGTAEGTTVVKNLGFSRELRGGVEFAIADDFLVLTAYDYYGRGSLWTSDGTTDGTRQLLASGQFSAPTPTVTGSPVVGTKLAGRVGTWTPVAKTYTYQWKLDGVPIEGATGKYFTIPEGTTGSITFAVTGSFPGFQTVTKTSVAKVVAREFDVAPVPTITGTKTVGSYLRAVPGTWSPAASFTYQWYSAGVKIATNGTRSTFKVTTATVGKPITVKVTGKAPGYINTNRSSAAR